MYNLFDNGTDVNFFMSPDRINDLMCVHVTRDTEYDAVLGCQDRYAAPPSVVRARAASATLTRHTASQVRACHPRV